MLFLGIATYHILGLVLRAQEKKDQEIGERKDLGHAYLQDTQESHDIKLRITDMHSS